MELFFLEIKFSFSRLWLTGSWPSFYSDFLVSVLVSLFFLSAVFLLLMNCVHVLGG